MEEDANLYIRQIQSQDPSWWRRGLTYLGRATRLKCPLCGTKPIFIPWYRTRTMRDWFTPLDGCPHCGYAYDREPGYFLMSIWALDYGFSAILGIVVYLGCEIFFHLTTSQILAATIIPVLIFSVVFARHAKAYFLAIDHYCDPHVRTGDDDSSGDGGGNQRLEPTPTAPTQPAGVPNGGGGGIPAEEDAGGIPTGNYGRAGHVSATPQDEPVLK